MEATVKGPAPTPDTATIYVAELTDNDVLLGRGQPILNYSGNVRFRQLVQSHKEAYTSTGKHSAKHEIATKILETIKERGGRFLRKIEDQKERDDLCIPEDVLHAWRIVDDAVKMSKVKQALREQLSKSNDEKQPKPKSRKKPRVSDESEQEISTGHGAGFVGAAAPRVTVMQSLAPQPSQFLPSGAGPQQFRIPQPPADDYSFPDGVLQSNTGLFDFNSMLPNIKQQQLSPQMLLLLQLQQRRQQEALAAWQQQQQQFQQPHQMLQEPGLSTMMFNPLASALMPAHRWDPASLAPGLDPSAPSSLHDAVQHYLASQQQQIYQQQALIAPLEPALLQANESGVSDDPGDTKPSAVTENDDQERNLSSDSSSAEQLLGEKNTD